MSHDETPIAKSGESLPWYALDPLIGEVTRAVVQVEKSHEQALLENGGRLATADTYVYYRQHRIVPLWVAIALLCFAEPRHWTVGQMGKVVVCRSRLRMAVEERRNADRRSPRPQAGVPEELEPVSLEWVRRWAIKALLPVPMLFPAKPSAGGVEPRKVVEEAQGIPRTASPLRRKRTPRVSGAKSAFMRETDLLELLPFSRSTLWRRVKAERFPRPVQPSPGVTAWVRADIDKWLDEQSSPVTPQAAKRARRKS